MTCYRWCELSLRTDIDMLELPLVDMSSPVAPEWRIGLLDSAPPERPRRAWFHQWAFPDGRPWVAFARDQGGYVLRFPDLADFDIVPSAQTIDIYARPSVPAHTLRHLLLDQVLPLVAGGRDRLVLHGSAVATDKGVMMFLGGSGYGKSTLAARLALKGLELVSDDCCLLVRAAAGFDVVPSYPGVRLGPDSVGELFGDPAGRYTPVAHYTSKVRVDGEQQHALRFRGHRLPLARIYVIAPNNGPRATPHISITRRERRAALVEVLNHTFYLDVEDPIRVREVFDLVADIASQYDVRSLAFPWELSKSDAVAEAILSDR